MPRQGFHPRSRSVSLEGSEGMRQVSLDGLEGVYAVAAQNSADASQESLGFSPRVAETRDTGRDIHEVLDFNNSVYDLTIQHSCLAAQSKWGRVGLANLAMVLALQCLNVYMQMSILFEVEELVALPAMRHAQELYHRFTEECYGTDPESFVFTHEVEANFEAWHDVAKGELCRFPLTFPGFFFIILLIWTFFLGIESKQTAGLAMHVLRLERPASGHVIIDDRGDDFVITHMSRRLKVWITVVVVLPKFVIAFVLWYIGARWLTATSGIDNLVLNSLALTFICEIDELIFQTCVPEVTKSSLGKTKLPLLPFKYAPTMWVPVEMAVTVSACIVLSLLYLYHLQDVIPEYRFDLARVCKHSASVFVKSKRYGHR